MRLTAHAGENAGPESIWGALNLRAERIGHGLTAAQDPELVEELATRQIPVEICITSNLRTGVCRRSTTHPVRQYFDQGIMITLNTDDPAMFRTSLAREYHLAQQSFGIQRGTFARTGAEFVRSLVPSRRREADIPEFV